MGFLTHLTIYNLLLSVLLYASLAYNPRMWMHRMPPEVVQKVPARTPVEKRLWIFVAVPFMLIMLVYPIVYVLQNPSSWLTNFLVLCAYFTGFAIWDTLVLDLLIFCRFTPSFIMIPGTTRKDYGNMRYHLKSGAKGVVMSLVFSAVLASAVGLFIR